MHRNIAQDRCSTAHGTQMDLAAVFVRRNAPFAFSSKTS
jgi:hypothetical protein